MLRSSFVDRNDNTFKINSNEKPPQKLTGGDHFDTPNMESPELNNLRSSPEKRTTVRENVMNRSRISELKLTSLSERKSIKREMRMSSMSKHTGFIYIFRQRQPSAQKE